MSGRDAPCILLVEDDGETREAVSRVLADEGYRVVGADRGEAGTRALKAGTIAAVILDVTLPDASGFDLCRDWRAAGVRVPVLMLTARTDVSSRGRGLDAGADDYLGKPFALSELRARLRAPLRRGRGPPPPRPVKPRGPKIDLRRRPGGRRAGRRREGPVADFSGSARHGVRDPGHRPRGRRHRGPAGARSLAGPRAPRPAESGGGPGAGRRARSRRGRENA